jgi:aspartate aminotransferase
MNIGISRIVQVSEQAKIVAPPFEKRTGEPFIYFQRGEVGYPTAPFIADGFKEAIEKGFTKYPKLGGEDYFKDAVLEDVYNNASLSFERDNIVAVHGGQQGLELVFSLFRGKTCTILTPCWSCMFDNILPYTESAFISVPLDPENNWSIRWEELEKALSVSEVFYFNSPHNPTGKVFSIEEIKKITYLCEKYGVNQECSFIQQIPHYVRNDG